MISILHAFEGNKMSQSDLRFFFILIITHIPIEIAITLIKVNSIVMGIKSGIESLLIRSYSDFNCRVAKGLALISV